MSEQAIEQPVKSLGKKVGPLPLWGYAAIIVGAAYGVYWWRHRVGVATPVTTSGEGLPSTGFETAGQMPGTNTYAGAVDQTAHAPASSQTNAQWARNTADSMIASGSNPTDINQAVTNYLGGKSLSATQQSIINTMLRTFGNPPEGVVAPITAPPTGHMYTVKSGDTLDSIMQSFYGRVNPIDKRLVQQNNLQSVTWDEAQQNFKPLDAGTVLSLPANGIAGFQQNTLNTNAGN